MIGEYNPQTFMSDFEKSMINAIRVVFPTTQQKGCFFHCCQCIWRKIQACGLKTQYENDAEFALKLRMLPALAFVPNAEVERSFETLCRSDIFTDEMLPVVDYFEDTWIARPNYVGRRPPAFPANM